MRTFKKLIQERDLEIAQQPDDLNFEEHDKFAKFDDLIKMLMKDVDLMTGSNKENVVEQFDKLQKAYSHAMTCEQTLDPVVYTSNNMGQFGLDFISWVDPKFVRDIDANMDWYMGNQHESALYSGFNEILLNIGYPSLQEKEFLQHVEHSQQRKNDDNYKRILKMISLQKQASGETLSDPAPAILKSTQPISRAVGA